MSWSAPDDGGSTITKYTVTPYIGSTAQTPKDVTGSPAATSTTISGLTNGTAYTFKVSATNAVGTSAQSAASDPVTPAAPVAGALAFVQQVNKRGVAASLALQPTAAVTTGNRLIVQVGVWSYGKATASGVTDSAGNTYTKLTSVKASDDTELSVWSAPITAGGGTRPTVTVTTTGSADIGASVLEYSGLSTAAGTGVVDALKTATGTTSAAGNVSSGATAASTAAGELAMGFYADSGFGNALTGDPTYTRAHQRVADRRHGAAGPGPRPDGHGHHRQPDHQDRGQHPVAGRHAGAQERRAAGGRSRGPGAGAVGGADRADGGPVVGRRRSRSPSPTRRCRPTSSSTPSPPSRRRSRRATPPRCSSAR